MLKAFGTHIIVRQCIDKSSEEKKLIISVKEEDPLLFEVISCGEEIIDLIPGDRIIVSYLGKAIDYNKEKLFIVEREQVLAIEVS